MASLERRHPRTHAALVADAPECAHPTQTNWLACDAAAAILDADAPHATPIFVDLWDRTAFGQSITDHRYTGNSPDPLGDAEIRRAETRAIAAVKRITLPAYRKVCASDDDYARAIAPAVEAIDLHSKKSLEALRKAHHDALAAPAEGGDDDEN